MDKTLLEKALAMPHSERTAFAELILENIDYEEDEVKQARISEIKDRIKAVNDSRSRLLESESLYNEDQNP